MHVYHKIVYNIQWVNAMWVTMVISYDMEALVNIFCNGVFFLMLCYHDHDVMLSWYYAIMMLCCHDVMLSWCYAIMMLCCNYILSWCYAVMILCYHDVMLSWCYVVMKIFLKFHGINRNLSLVNGFNFSLM